MASLISNDRTSEPSTNCLIRSAAKSLNRSTRALMKPVASMINTPRRFSNLSLNVVLVYWTLALHRTPVVEKQSRQENRNQRHRSKIQGYGKDERRISRTGTEPVGRKIDLLILESDQWTASDLEVAPQRFGSVDYYSRTKPGYRCAAKLRPAVKEISRTSPSIEEIFALSKELDWLVTDRDRIAWGDSGDISEHTAEHGCCLEYQLLSNTEVVA